MKTPNKVVWLDDNPDRASTAEDLGATFVDVKNQDLALKVEELLNGPSPPLVIVDHILDKTTTTNPLFQRGSTIAEAIKEHWPACPVVGVTNADNVQDIDVRTRRAYDVLYPFVDFGDYLSRIDVIARDFANIVKAKAKRARDLVKLLAPPDGEIERLVTALPDDLKDYFRDASVASRLFSWVNRLMARAGFLYDDLWAATCLGLNEAGFQKVEAEFKKGKYTGVFAWDDDPRWWACCVTDLLFKQCTPEMGEPSWQVGRRLPGIKAQHHSICYVCQKEFPETVAYLDVETTDRKAMHLKCTKLHPHYKQELYFEDVRMMRGT